jgi:hypothetical protein
MISRFAIDSHMSVSRRVDQIDPRIFNIRGQHVMLDSDLAAIYEVTTKRLNEQLRRLTAQELINLRSQIATSKGRGGRRYLPWVFTEHGALMLASVLNSEIAVQASVRVVRAFVRLRQMVTANAQLAGKLEEFERRLDLHDEAIVDLFAALKRLLEPIEPQKKREIGFHVRERSSRYKVKKRI